MGKRKNTDTSDQCITTPSKKVFLDETFGPRQGQKHALPQELVEKKELSRNGRKKLKKKQKKQEQQSEKKREAEEDDSNALILPTEKKKVEKTVPTVEKRKLSKKERKKLEKKVELAEKRAKRADILAELQKFQATSKELSVLTSIKEVHTQRVQKRLPASDVKLVSRGFAGIKKWKLGKRRKQQKNSGASADAAEPESTDSSDLSSDEDAAEEKVEEEDEMEADDGEEEEEEGEESEEDAGEETGGETELKLKQPAVVKPKKGDSQANETTATSTSEGKPSSSCKSDASATVSSGQKKAASSAETASSAKADSSSQQGRPSTIVVEREPTIQKSRLKLPILGMEQEVVEAIHENPAVIIVGDTGSGKTTQVPQFLYEAGYAHGKGIIAITEPRRVAAISMSKRVAQELNLSTKEVSYQIRSEGNVTPDTKIKFMTDGVLLREIQNDFLLTKYSCVVIDEAHERNVFTDILIGLLSRIIGFRKKKGNPLKLIIMSATLRIEDFTENSHLFKVKPPVVKVEGRQFDVDIHWLKQTPTNYLGAAYRKVCQVHNDLPEGGILVFVTGQQEVHTLCHWLRQSFPSVAREGAKKPEKTRRRRKDKKNEKKEEAAEIQDIDLDNYSTEPLQEGMKEEEEEEEEKVEALMDFELPDDALLAGDEEEGEADFTPLTDVYRGQPMWVLPLYSLLSSERQAKVFEPPPEGCRLCVVATNVAETSLTIPNIRYIVDTGKTKTRLYDRVTGVSTFHVTWTSKASADQRKGRAGRVGPGKCYRLYSSAVFNDEFEEFSCPEIVRRPIEDIVLLMKSLNIVNVLTFPFPTAPKSEQVEAAERVLTSLGALDKPEKKGEGAKLTEIGRVMSMFPVAPRYAKMLALSNQRGLLQHMVALVSVLSVDQVFLEDFAAAASEEEKEARKQKMQMIKKQKREFAGLDQGRLLGDMMVLLCALLAVESEGPSPKTCERYNLRYKAIVEIRKLRQQLTNTFNALQPDIELTIDPKLKPPTQEQALLMRQVVLSGLGDHVARRWHSPPVGEKEPRWKHKHAYQCMELEEPVYVHPGSVLNHQQIEYVMYQEIVETEGGTMFMRGVAAAEMEWLPVYAAGQCILSLPLDDPPPAYDAKRDMIVCHQTASFGRSGWALPAVQLPYPNHRDKVRWFARFLLEGEVEPALAKWSKCLLNTPHTMVRSWAHLQPRTTRLLQALLHHVVDTRKQLREIWAEDPQYLLREYLDWLPEALHSKVTAEWPPCKA